MTEEIVLFVVPGCPLCEEARTWLNAHGITYGELNIENNYSARRRMFKLTRQQLVPVLMVGEHFAVRPSVRKIIELCVPPL